MKTRRGWLVKRGRTFYATWEVSGKRFQKTTGESDRRKAESRLAEIMRPFLVEDEVRTLESVKARIEGAKGELAKIEEDRNPPLAVADAWDAYERAGNRREIGAMTMRNYQGYWDAFARWLKVEHPEAVQLRQVSFGVAEEYWQSLIAGKVTGRTCNAHRAFMRSFFNVLTDKAKLTNGNPWARIAKRDEHSVGRRPLTVEELRRVCQSAEGELRTLLALGLYLGCRMGDAACMDWGCVDLARRLIRYTPRKTARRSPEPLLIPIHPELAAILSETPPEKRTGPVCPDMAERYTRRGPDAVSAPVQRHFEKLGMVTTAERNGAGIRRAVSVGFHSMRHSAVSLLRDAGAAQSVSMALVGHHSPDVHNLYTHTDPDAMRRAVGALPAVMTDAPPALPVGDPMATLKSKVRELAEGMNPKTWKAARAELLAMTATV